MAKASLNPATLLANIPSSLRGELVAAYAEVLDNYREHRWEPSELNAGKLCEVVFSIIRGHVDGTFPAHSSKPSNMVDACKALEAAPSTFPRSIRIQIPRMLVALYEVRNNRGVGHVSGDVNPNHMDATCVLAMSKWLLAELVRVFHNVSTDEAGSAVDSIVERTLPLVWEVHGRLRVLDTGLSMLHKALVLLYFKDKPLAEEDLFEWVEHSNAAVFRRDVLRRAHKQKLLDYDAANATVVISPLGRKLVEEIILHK